jgi:ubiquinone/menaquinone biosynthesis C-methylase UbiE
MTTTQPRTGSDPTYLLRRDEVETQRLMQQAQLNDPFTRRLLREAGVEVGMTVLDIGSGAGDVAFIAAELVGPSGKVIGIDSDPAVLETARTRAGQLGIDHVSFITGDCRSLDLNGQVDAVIGRMVLMYMADPVDSLRLLVNQLRPGGVVAFQELNTTPESVRSGPSLPIWRNVAEWAQAAVRHAGLDQEMGFALRQVFIDAGLPEPRMTLESAIGGGPDWEGYDYLASSIRSMSPLIHASGIATPEEVDVDTLADRLRTATIAANGVGKTPDMVSAWATAPWSTNGVRHE